jgi:hypothetical protein
MAIKIARNTYDGTKHQVELSLGRLLLIERALKALSDNGDQSPLLNGTLKVIQDYNKNIRTTCPNCVDGKFLQNGETCLS